MSEKAYVKAPTKPLPITAINCPLVSSSLFGNIFFARCVIDQKRNTIVKALAKPDMAFTIIATFVTSPAKRENILARIINNGAPGGCPTSSLNAVAINSPQSQKLVVGSMVNKYTVAAIKNTIQPVTRFTILNFSIDYL